MCNCYPHGQGFAYFDDIETPFEWGKLWMSYGDWLSGSDAAEYADKRAALEAYHAAREHFERMGAQAKLTEAVSRVERLTAELLPAKTGAATATTSSSLIRDVKRPPRRPRGAAELERRSAWAWETFGLVTGSKVVLDLLDDVAKLAVSETPILVLGESGTGKELVALGIHKLSKRTGNFVPVNCGALPREIIESELFGHMAGSFTGATKDKPGLFEVCDGGTVFLDEIGEMSFELQSRLLRFLETGESRRIGSNRNARVDTRIIAATNQTRETLERGSTFRCDLYYRLAHAIVTLPPLRRRIEDIELLTDHFIEKACRQYRKVVSISEGARERLIAHPWPGNVRQLRSTLNRLVILAEPDHVIGPEEIEVADAQVASTLTEELEQAERRRMIEVLAQAKGVKSEAARLLGMSRTTFVSKMKRLRIR